MLNDERAGIMQAGPTARNPGPAPSAAMTFTPMNKQS
jgi:hypothetical protein